MYVNTLYDTLNMDLRSCESDFSFVQRTVRAEKVMTVYNAAKHGLLIVTDFYF